MSGLYLIGMEMPDEFDSDVYIELACGIDGHRYARLYNFHHGGLTEWCEIIPVPDHGRLIDADAFIKKCKEMADDENGNQLDALVLLEWFLEQNAPTVIPANGGNENVDS